MSALSYLRCFLASEADRDDLEEGLKEVMDHASSAEGFVWIEMGRDISDDRKHMVVSEWSDAAALERFEQGEAFRRFLGQWPDERWAEPLELRRLQG